MKIEIAEKIVVQITSWPARVESAPISWAMGTLETATGAVKSAAIAANCAPLKSLRKRRKAVPREKMGTAAQRMIVPKMISFLREAIAENSNSAPRIIREIGVVMEER